MQTKRKLKLVVLLACAVLVVLTGVGATVAYIITSAPSVTAQFDLADVKCELVAAAPVVNADLNGVYSCSYTVKNTSNISVYAKVTVTWNDVSAKPEISVGDANWQLLESNSNSQTYYLVTSLAEGASYDISFLVRYEGEESLELNAVAEVIQAEPASAVLENWGLLVSESGTLSPISITIE